MKLVNGFLNKTEEKRAEEYQVFIKEHQVKANLMFNKFLWFSMILGPALYACVLITDRVGKTHYYTSDTCLTIFVATLILALLHSTLRAYWPNSPLSYVVGLTGLEVLIIIMDLGKVSINITYFLVPLLSLIFCNKLLYYYCVTIAYISMVVNFYLNSTFYGALNLDETPFHWFASTVSGLTIEFVVMSILCYELLNVLTGYIISMYGDAVEIHVQELKNGSDSLTGLWKRDYMENHFDDSMAIKQYGALIIMDLDNFKDINDRYGHTEGDAALMCFSRTLRHVFRNHNEAILSRYGGDEFLVFLPGITDKRSISELLSTTMKQATDSFSTNSHYDGITISMGVSITSDRLNNLKDAFLAADKALLISKKGKNQFNFNEED